MTSLEQFDPFFSKLLVNDLKETNCRVPDMHFEEWTAKNTNIPSIEYELPDDTVVDLGLDRFKIPELLFNPDLLGDKVSMICKALYFLKMTPFFFFPFM